MRHSERHQRRVLRWTWALAITVAVASGPALAHPGHGAEGASGWSVAHYLMTPSHLLVVGLGLSLMVAVGRGAIVRKRPGPEAADRPSSHK